MRLPISQAGRTADASLDTPTETEAEADACVVACPPHPQHGGNRSDERLRAVSDALVERGVACLRIDYGPWDEGRGESDDAAAAVDAMRERGYDAVGVFGYSFGAGVALVAARALLDDEDGDGDAGVDAVSVLAPPARVAAIDASDAVERVAETTPLQVVYGSRDTTVDSGPVVAAARERGCAVVELSADHFFVGQAGKVADAVAPFLVGVLV